MRPHAGLLVYQKSVDATVIAEVVATSIGARRPDLVDQLRRAVSSIPLNIAEGASEFSHPEKARFYRIARRSASECHAILDVAQRTLDGVSDPEPLRQHLDAIGAMLTTMIKNKGGAGARERPRP